MTHASQCVRRGQAGRRASDDEEVECTRSLVGLVWDCWSHRQRGNEGIWGEPDDGGCKYILKITKRAFYLSAMSGQANWIIGGRKFSNVVRNDQGDLIFDWECPEYSLVCYQGTLGPLIPTDRCIHVCCSRVRVCRLIF